MRERVIDVLSQSFADDRLLTEEFEHRIQLAYRATTSADLERLVSDLRVERDGNSIAGSLTVNRPDVPDALLGPSIGVVRVTGTIVLGSVQIDVAP